MERENTTCNNCYWYGDSESLVNDYCCPKCGKSKDIEYIKDEPIWANQSGFNWNKI